MVVVGAPAGHAAAAAPQPITAAFYYAWYPETFQPTPHAMPALGHYQSTDLGLIRTHLDVLRRAGVQAAIVSWWGITDRSDARFQRLEQVTEQLHSPERLAIYYEPEGQGDPSVDRLSADITHVLALARSPAYLRVDGRPVIFAFSESGDGCSMVTRWNAANRGRAHIVLKVFPGYRSCSDQPTSWHEYAPAQAQVLVPGQSFSVSPGFFHARESQPRLARSVARFRDSVRAMYAAQVRWRLITTFNEWGEGTAVEASTSWGNAYMDVLASAAPPPPKPPPPPRPRQQRLGVASVAIAAGSRSALVTARIGTGATPRRVLVRVEWGSTRRYGHHTAWRVVRRTVGLRRLRFRIGPLPARGRTHLRVVVRSGSHRRTSGDHLVPRSPRFVAVARRGPQPRAQQPLRVASVAVAAGGRSALVTARIGTGGSRQRVLARVEWGSTARYGHRTAWRVVPRTSGLRRLRFRIGPLSPTVSVHLRVVVRRGHLRRRSGDRVIDRPPPHIAAAGDIACGSSSGGAACQQAGTAALVERGKYASVLALGDLQYEQGALAEFRAFYDKSWGAFKSITSPAVGNHEYLTPDAAGYFAYFGPRAGDPSRGYYSFDVGRWHLVALNSNCGRVGGCKAGSPQEQWLRADLAAHPASCTLAYWHHPRFSSGGHGDNVSVQPLWQVLAGAHAELALSGHDHDYERFAPIDGIRQFVVGTGGRNQTAFRKKPDSGSQMRLRQFGILDLELAPTSYTWRFRAAPTGEVLDSGTTTCH